MGFEYLHQAEKNGEQKYNFQLIKWLIERGFISSDKTKRILDLSSGQGHFYFSLKEMGYSNVFAVDLCPQFKECEKGDITKKLPYKNGFFDIILSRDVAEHISDSKKFFEEQHRILKKKGVIIVMTPNAEKLSLGEFFADYTHVMPYTRKSLQQALIMHGFDRVQVRRLRAIPRLWAYTTRAFDFLYSSSKNNLLAIGTKK